MAISFRPIMETIGVECAGVDLTQPLDDASYTLIRRRWIDAGIMLFRGQALTIPAQKNFSLRFGTHLDIHLQKEFLHREHPEVLVLSNIKDESGRPIGTKDGGRHWHSDLYWHEIPAVASFLFGKECPPERGDTQFISMEAVYRELPAHLKRQVEGRKVLISRVRSWPIDYPHRPPLTEAEKKGLPDVIHPMVRTHPESGRKSIYIGNEASAWIVGMPDDEGKAVIKEIMDFARQPRFLYSHKWKAGDAILWDNRSVMHSATPYDEINHRRLMYRTTIMDHVRPM